MIINDDIMRLTVLDISGVYSKIYDEIYIEKNKVDEIISKYDLDTYRIVDTTI